MNTANIVQIQHTDALPRVQSATRERLTHRVNSEILCERALIAITLGMATFLFYVCYHAVRSYGVM
jgi:hypothetical protein